MAYLEIKNIYKNFGRVEVLKGVDLEVDKGQVVSVIGSSGSGKTTFLRCLNFLEKPDDGSIVLDGETLLDCEEKKKYGEKELREKRLNFGLVFQSFNLFPQYSVFKNITLAPTLQLREKTKEYKKQLKNSGESNVSVKAREYFLDERKKIRENTLALLKKVGLEDKSYSYPCELSGGQSQRVAIARALALKPKILCFDEPTSALDPELTGEVLKVIKSLKGEDITMIIVTHEMGFAKNVSDKIVFMADGVVEEEGDSSIITDPKSEKLKAFLQNVEKKDGE